METENIGFWTIALPAITALLGSAIGILGTYFVTKNRNQHDSEMRKQEFSEAQKVRNEEWERSETKRKEERHFELKRRAYEKFLTILGDFPKLVNKNLIEELLPSLLYIHCYASTQVKEQVGIYMAGIYSATDVNLSQNERDKAISTANYSPVKEAIRKDLASHFNLIK